MREGGEGDVTMGSTTRIRQKEQGDGKEQGERVMEQRRKASREDLVRANYVCLR